ncbi:hypothetical protein IFM89_026752 [Coptis chinensis]|uniref:pyridoxal 5'-phosphate synthase (glutamine hydrolyzing) n=1 Tax=Coptis chinensis TaxID=261450 RepID=A0A835I1U8_9MAGN|nr:hypothetical protein IFM89_026752 [Coptis chinensis]
MNKLRSIGATVFPVFSSRYNLKFCDIDAAFVHGEPSQDDNKGPPRVDSEAIILHEKVTKTIIKEQRPIEMVLGKDSPPTDEVLNQCCLAIEESLNSVYRQGRVADNSIGPLEIRIVKGGTFEELMDYAISRDTFVPSLPSKPSPELERLFGNNDGMIKDLTHRADIILELVFAPSLESIGIDYIDESEVLTLADEDNHINKHNFRVPFVCGCRNLGEVFRRICEGAVMICAKGEAGTGNIVEAVRHVRLPVVQFASGGVATPADAALMMQLGCDGVIKSRLDNTLFSSIGLVLFDQPKRDEVRMGQLLLDLASTNEDVKCFVENSACKGSTLTDAGDALSAMYIPCNEYGSKFLSPLQVVCGAAHTIIVAHSGYGLWASGTGRSGGLGSDNPANSYAPRDRRPWLTVDEDFQDALEFAGQETRIQDEEP